MNEPLPPRGGVVRNPDGHHPFFIFYQHLRELCGTAASTGWRHAFCWGGIGVVLMAYLARLNGAAVDLRDYHDLAGLILAAFVFRGAVDKGGLIPLAEIMFNRKTPQAGVAG